ncbi:MAG: ferrous iron transport protein B [Omnitrophica WOR_2 bacterium RIFCSPLOWO2_02_FULL_63_16]|nr:MAG: ferrous iron transport protein B [Omnitrophica WOR_2 bacterium GWA2_63_20]OGX45775.1 MAG: ferrous iron transport protein B [Omnitrophica WOR_2 bacterium RIFCSPLOWO2_02_FULL_63_16]OGX49383.1 MAG: ferrous iron transport protein B [Omnitrophica WOR_2 bacterium RIFCSPLOWO2_12_FULL_63_16]
MTPSTACHPPGADAVSVSASQPTVVVTGNPNVGKSVIFQLLTGRYTTVSNYPGTTVMVARGGAVVEGRRVAVCDTPGLNSLQAASEDELVARDLLLGDHPTVVQVADAKNLARALALTLELSEAGLPTVLDLNMIDEARERRVTIDVDRLGETLRIPVVPTIATQRWGLERLRAALLKASVPVGRVRYPDVIEEAAAHMERLLPDTLTARRALALLWLSGDRALIDRLGPQLAPELVQRLQEIAGRAQQRCPRPLGLLISHARLRHAHRLAAQVMTSAPVPRRAWLDRLGALAMHPVWGVPILVAALWVMYFLVGDLAAQRAVGFLEETVFGQWLIPAFQWVVRASLPWAWAQGVTIGEYGLLTMALPYAFAIILPIVTMFFLCFGFIEDVGYLPRLAVMANRFCRLVGLNGKAVLPLVLGLGCDTMATMTTRILDSRRDRIITTLLLALGIPCSAQLGVIAAMLSGQPPAALGLWIGVVLLVVLIVGQAASRLLPGEGSPFLYELPPLRRPKLSNVLIKTLGRVEWYVKEAVPLFFLGTLVLFVLDAVGALFVLERLASPLIVSWLGLPAKATGAFLVGFLRRDFGAAGLFALQRAGQLDGVQTVVSLVTITLFVPCIAQYFMMVKERGWKMANLMAAFVFGTALLVGGILWRILTGLRVVW